MSAVHRLGRRLFGPWTRRALLVAALAAMWLAWALIPAPPAICWECPARQSDSFQLTPDGGTVVHRAGLSFSEVFSMPSFASQHIVLPARLCDAATGRQRLELFAHDDIFAGITGFSPDGSWFLTEGEVRHRACLRDAADGHELFRFAGDDRSMWQVRINPKGHELALKPPDKAEVQLWDVATRRVRVVLPGAKHIAAYSPDGQQLATISWTESSDWPGPKSKLTATIWDVATGRALTRQDLPAFIALDCLISRGGRWAAALWEAPVPGRSGHDSVDFRQFAPETAIPGAMRLWDVATGKAVTLVEFSDSSKIDGIEFSRDGQWFLLRTRTGTQFWDLRSSPPMPWTPPDAVMPGYRNPRPHFLDGTDCMAIIGDDHTAQLWNTADMSRRAVCRLRAAENASQFVTSPDGSLLAVLLDSYSPLHRRVPEFLHEHFGFPKTLQRHCLVQLFDTQTGTERAVFDQDGESQILGFSPDGRMVWTTSFIADGGQTEQGMAVIRGWALPSGRPPIWLLAVTVAGLLLLFADCYRGRRHAPARAVFSD